MKNYGPIIIAFFIGAMVVSAGLGEALYVGLLAFGFLSMVVFIALVWMYLDRKKTETNAPPGISGEINQEKPANHTKDAKGI